jgi:hypothetical protein
METRTGAVFRGFKGFKISRVQGFKDAGIQVKWLKVDTPVKSLFYGQLRIEGFRESRVTKGFKGSRVRVKCLKITNNYKFSKSPMNYLYKFIE